MHATIDLETRNKIKIKAGAAKYSRSAEVMCLSYQIGEEDVKSWKPGEPLPEDLFEFVRGGGEVHAHNANFEINIWNNVLVPAHGFPPMRLEQWRCTMAECFARGIPPSLENAAIALDLDVEKDMVGKRLMQKLCRPRRPSKHNPNIWHEKPEELQRLRDYCDQDVITEAGVSKKIQRLPPREQSVFLFDQKVNERGVMVDRDLAESAVELWDHHCRSLDEELSRITFGALTSPRQVAGSIEVIRGLGVLLPDMTAPIVEEFLKRDLGSATARRILEIRQASSLTSIAKYKAMLLSICEDDRIRGCFQYHGANTGRWAGRIVQLQNLPRGVIKYSGDDPDGSKLAAMIEDLVELVKTRDLNLIKKESGYPLGDLLSGLVRSSIVAPPGKKFIVCDFASVEARGLAWAAGEEWLLRAFEAGLDSYVEMASEIYGIPTSKVTKEQRFYGKTAVLGCGYMLGARGFQGSLANFGVEADLPFCQSVVDAYRAKNRRIKSFWYKIGNAAISAVESGKPHKAGPFIFHTKGDWLLLRLPCGRDVPYYQPKVIAGDYGPQIQYTMAHPNTGKPVRNRTYAGKLTENAIQAICRDLLVEAMSRLERAGYQVVAHVHDEVVLEVDVGFGSLEEVEAIMNEVPSWAKGFPVDSEGFECLRYRK